jgi:hypothetical protein
MLCSIPNVLSAALRPPGCHLDNAGSLSLANNLHVRSVPVRP